MKYTLIFLLLLGLFACQKTPGTTAPEVTLQNVLEYDSISIKDHQSYGTPLLQPYTPGDEMYGFTVRSSYSGYSVDGKLYRSHDSCWVEGFQIHNKPGSAMYQEGLPIWRAVKKPVPQEEWDRICAYLKKAGFWSAVSGTQNDCLDGNGYGIWAVKGDKHQRFTWTSCEDSLYWEKTGPMMARLCSLLGDLSLAPVLTYGEMEDNPDMLWVEMDGGVPNSLYVRAMKCLIGDSIVKSADYISKFRIPRSQLKDLARMEIVVEWEDGTVWRKPVAKVEAYKAK